jgi:hypothetical protein
MSEIFRRWAILAFSGAPEGLLRAFHKEHHQALVDEVIRHGSTPEGFRALREEIDALRQQVLDPCNGPLPVVE